MTEVKEKKNVNEVEENNPGILPDTVKEDNPVDEVKKDKSKKKKTATPTGEKPDSEPVDAIVPADQDPKKALKSLIAEVGSQHKIHTGVIVGVKPSSQYPEQANRRDFVIKCGLSAVFMDENDAFESLKDIKKGTDLINKEIRFKVKEVVGDSLYVSSKAIHEDFRKKIESQKIMTGTASGVITDRDDPEAEFIIFDYFGLKLYMPRLEVHYILEKRPLGRFIGTTFRFVAIDIAADDKIIVSSRKILEEKRELIIQELETGAVIEAEVRQLPSFGARLYYKNVLMVMRDKDFSVDYTKMKNILKEGDIIPVKLNEISKTKRIFVEPEQKYKSHKVLHSEAVVPGNLLQGEISTVTTFGCFVNVAPGCDALCPMPREEVNIVPAAGMKVKIKITQVNDKGARGIIIGSIFNREGSHFDENGSGQDKLETYTDK